jgi:hypothetical protein
LFNDPNGDCPICPFIALAAFLLSESVADAPGTQNPEADKEAYQQAKTSSDIGMVLNLLPTPKGTGPATKTLFAKEAAKQTTKQLATNKLKTVIAKKTAQEIKEKIETKADNTYSRVKVRKPVLEKVKENQPKNEKGELLDPYTFQPLDPLRTDLGHKPGQEWKTRQQMHKDKGSTRKEVIETENDPSLYQLEDRTNNRSHKYEKKGN